MKLNYFITLMEKYRNKHSMHLFEILFDSIYFLVLFMFRVVFQCVGMILSVFNLPLDTNLIEQFF